MNRKDSLPPVSIIIPMYNAEKDIGSVIEAILSQDYQGETEIIVVNDGSKDKSREIVRSFERKDVIKVIDQNNQGAVTATNNGFEKARYNIICSIDSDVVLHKDWIRKIVEEFEDGTVGAVQGYYKTPKGVSFWARMMGYDVEKRYDDIKSKYVTQVCTGNTAYAKKALEDVGLFDPRFTYAYDNDMSYRLVQAGYKLVFRKDAECDHYWKADIKSYIKQQYWSSYGRLQLVQKHPSRITGDSVSGMRMILQAPLTLFTVFSVLLGTVFKPFMVLAAGLFGVIMIDRILFALGIIRKHRDCSAFLLPFVYLLRNIIWSWAFLHWFYKSLTTIKRRNVGGKDEK